MARYAASGIPTIGDLTSTVRLLQRRLNALEHLCDEADTIRATALPVATIRAALRAGIER